MLAATLLSLPVLLPAEVSVTIGHFLGATLPARPMALASAIAFLIFAAWAWREGAAADDEAVSPGLEPRLALLTDVSSFALAEMSDKTTLAPAIGSGRLLHRRLPHQLLHVLASMLFVTIGLWMLLDSALGWRPANSAPPPHGSFAVREVTGNRLRCCGAASLKPCEPGSRPQRYL
ncbi:TMEM165/GDT1 family protein [Mycobacterium montefiorense]|uniref:hypothetical protein n=1 Tax=Mycobacterium montefiorense TaxID=154654 RepID=UPI0021F2CDAA|nr:hypothetical protein [Mycobacterium montefiorense]